MAHDPLEKAIIWQEGLVEKVKPAANEASLSGIAAKIQKIFGAVSPGSEARWGMVAVRFPAPSRGSDHDQQIRLQDHRQQQAHDRRRRRPHPERDIQGHGWQCGEGQLPGPRHERRHQDRQVTY